MTKIVVFGVIFGFYYTSLLGQDTINKFIVPRLNERNTAKEHRFFNELNIEDIGRFIEQPIDGYTEINTYYKTGKLKSKAIVSIGVAIDSIFEFYHVDTFSILNELVVRYKKFGFSGHFFKWYENGQIESEMFFSNKSDSIGTWKYYSEDGRLSKIINYNNGLRDGDYYEYYPNGFVKIKGHFQDGNRSREWGYYSNDSLLIKKENYQADLLIGEYVEYYLNGNLKLKGNYVHTKTKATINFDPQTFNEIISYEMEEAKDGEWLYYDENDKIVKTEIYKNGKIIKKE